jgi:hypothetical protein
MINSTELKRSPNYPGVALKDLQPLVHATLMDMEPDWGSPQRGLPMLSFGARLVTCGD